MPAFFQTVSDGTSAFRLLVMLMACSVMVELLRRIVSGTLRSRSASVRCLALQLGFLALALAPICYVALPGIPLRQRVLIVRDRALGPVQQPPVVSLSVPREAPPTSTGRSVAKPSPTGVEGLSSAVSGPQRFKARQTTRSISLVSASVAVWLVGVVWLGLRLILGHLVQARVVASASLLEDSTWRARLKRAAQGGLLDADRFEVRLSGDIEVPMVAGLWRPRILLPQSACQWSAEEADLVFRHELAHLQRHDLAWQMLALATRCVYWFQPLTWLSWHQLKIERECACDDLVLRGGGEPSRYAALLRDLACAMRGHPLASAGIAMAERHHLVQRVERALDENQARRPVGRTQRRLTVVFTLLMAVGLTTPRPFAESVAAITPAQNDADSELENEDQEKGAPDATETAAVEKSLEPDFVRLPETLPGQVLDRRENPIAGAAVTAELMHYHGHDNDYELVRRWALTTDAAGRYEIDTRGLDTQPSSAFIITEARQQGFAQESSGWGHRVSRVAQRGELSPLKMSEGRMITGRVMDPEGNPMGRALIKGRASLPPNAEGNPRFWWPGINKCAEDGTFSIGCPPDAKIRLWVYGEGAVPKYVSVEDQDDLGDLRMSRGAQVTGTLLDRDEQPVSGVCVAMQFGPRDPALASQAMSSSIQFATLTDGSGRFTLPQVDTTFLIWVAASERDARRSDCVRGLKAPPCVSPRFIEPAPGQQRLDIVLHEASVVIQVTGTVRWPDGTPAKGVRLQTAVSAREAKFHGGSPWLSVTHTDSQGKYSLKFPANTTYGLISAYGKKNKEGVWHYALAAAGGPADRGDLQMMEFLELTEDVTGADWSLLKKEDAFTEPRKVLEPEPKFAELDQVYREYAPHWMGNTFFVAGDEPVVPDPPTPESRQRLVDRLFDLEARNQGQELGLQALVLMLQEAQSVGDPSDPLYGAVPKAYERLLADYLDSPSLDLTLGLNAGPPTKLRLQLLRRAASQGQSRQIQGLAKYHLARFLFKFAGVDQFAGFDQAQLAKLSSRDDQQSRELWNFLKTMDRKALKTEAIAMCQELSAFDDVVYTTAQQARQGSAARYRVGGDAFSRGPNPSLAKIAEGLLNDRTKLIVGQPVMEIVGETIGGESLRLSDYRGRVVLLLLKPQLLGEQDRLTEVRNAFTADQLAILSVDAYQNKFAYKLGVKQGDIFEADRGWWEQAWLGPICTAWHADSSQGYVIDPSGVIQWKGVDIDQASEKIAQLIRSK